MFPCSSCQLVFFTRKSNIFYKKYSFSLAMSKNMRQLFAMLFCFFRENWKLHGIINEASLWPGLR